jgi:hypothetical protein
VTPPGPWTITAVLATAALLTAAAAVLRVHFTHRPSATIRPATPAAGWATPEQLARHLSAEAARRAGNQVRPGLAQKPANLTKTHA